MALVPGLFATTVFASLPATLRAPPVPGATAASTRRCPAGRRRSTSFSSNAASRPPTPHAGVMTDPAEDHHASVTG
ncbi:MAG: hypothetical protein DMF95_09080 [Acidobacteria bacterium]|nr:MAG: hypothetical protein DMF96_04535 [Acidobacteriota bacterium]PYR19932.1 MAG: hypothetical protein DMF94_13910 [Acidobacteriota bacterium]PYR51118.1 MAG: hypothetical protein DMF95_09080 [Acidobacteriota bacterium]